MEDLKESERSKRAPFAYMAAMLSNNRINPLLLGGGKQLKLNPKYHHVNDGNLLNQ